MNNILTSKFGFDQDNFYPMTIFLILFGSSLYYFLSKQLLESLFKSEDKIKSLMKETLHELNTPVATIQLNNKMLKKKVTDEKNLKRVERIDEACEDLLNLYNQMEYTIKEQIDSITHEPFNIDEIISKSIRKFDDIKNDISINYTSTTLVINADKNGFEKMIDNLISNAIKYNKPKGTIDIALNDKVLSVKDTGIGIDTKNLFHVFDKYYQENSLSNGIGLGLNIVKKYCDKNTIQIKIDSQKDMGTTFYLDFSEIADNKGVK
ncbi:MAG: HAMP domain-containing sensor histidine kinase [Campylobacterota bacterium]|nr:HAMP domain-containing sensor histidine kinase [Campylobacterota bacterium]